MPSTLKICLLALVSLVVAMPSSPNADPNALFAVEKRCVGIYGRCNNDCCDSMRCNYIPICGPGSRCVSYDPAIPYNPTCN
ncbi:uncharacterized protein CTRU02_215709 [Colletotrichum truncatum]|uniref:Uncharacterized protein n=1 Tax=Colletotrichum truncatum TaxID=5467 RepID=A0ACC3YC01_COLTU|nr:uncharacterized protein CTRU02_14916 [Colletotrichum truncatum]KAF6781618.1 hypothetical protein CTRU02_14916 [Colletotrichum truncatum]